MLLGDAYVHLLGHQLARHTEQKRRAERVIKTIPRLLTQAMQCRDVEPKERLDAGRLLAQLGEIPTDLDDFIAIPDQPFRIGKYPVTNYQYARFMAAGGYHDDRWWGDSQGRKNRDRHSWFQPRYWRQKPFDGPAYPVVGVNWHEANAYCAWLTIDLRLSNEIGDNEESRLPNEAEWMAAAHADEAAYPWGNDALDTARSNTEESNLGQTSPVHMYPEGQTRDEVWDLSGNVWEWSFDTHEDGWPYWKGGSWASAKERVKSVTRSWDNPASWDQFVGFRCVVVPISG